MSKRVKKEQPVDADNSEETAFPSARYFQVHFQHLSQLIENLQLQLQETNRQLNELRQAQQPSSSFVKPTIEEKVKRRSLRMNGNNPPKNNGTGIQPISFE
jgi:hypothetical protein